MSRARHEYKYLINQAEEELLRQRAACILAPDPYSGPDGSYFIRSLYFDDHNDSCLLDNESGTDRRSKFRMRYYNDDISLLRLEKKSKVRGMTIKVSCPLTPEEGQMLAEGRIPAVTPDLSGQKQQLFLELQLRCLTPRVIVSYERIPFVYPAGNVRITFDRKLSSSGDTGRFLSGDYGFRPVMSLGSSVLEVKWDQLLPLHIQDSLQLNSLQWTSFSKYYMCRVYHL